MTQTYLEVHKLCKTFTAKNGSVEALKGVSLSIGKGEIFGVIGLSGAGKSTLAKAVAKKLNILHVDTGAIYRTIGYAAFSKGVDPKDGEAAAALLPELEIGLHYGEDGLQHMTLNGADVTDQIRLPEISLYASAVSAHPAVRAHLLEMQREHLEQLISHAREIQQTGVFSMDFSKFDTSEIEKYTAEAKQKWGKTPAWQEFEKKNITPRQAQKNADDLMDIFARFGAIRGTSPASKGAQALVAKLQTFITNHYYTCTKEILQSLGQMYIAGDSMTENIDAAGGAGTAQFAHAAITEFCK